MDNYPHIVIVSNVFSHHQKPLSDALYEQTKGSFAFVETLGLTQELKTLGYQNENDPAYLFRSYAGDEEICAQMIRDADIVVFGSAPEKMLQERLRLKKLVFRCSERPLKNGNEMLKYPVRYIRWHRRNPGWAPIYLLCASAYAAGDYARFGLFRGKAYRWGYFPPTVCYEDPNALLSRKDPKKLLWCGRFLDCKRIEDLLYAVRMLKDRQLPFSLDFIGTGKLAPELKEMCERLQISDRVHFLGSMPPDQVRQHMEEAGIYIVSSDQREGWGAVVNEAMNSACALVASHAVGAVPYLVKQGVNGLVYPSRDVSALTDCLEQLLEHPGLQQGLGHAAYETIVEEWNAEVSAARLLSLAEAILGGKDAAGLFPTGPCSSA